MTRFRPSTVWAGLPVRLRKRFQRCGDSTDADADMRMAPVEQLCEHHRSIGVEILVRLAADDGNPAEALTDEKDAGLVLKQPLQNAVCLSVSLRCGGFGFLLWTDRGPGNQRNLVPAGLRRGKGICFTQGAVCGGCVATSGEQAAQRILLDAGANRLLLVLEGGEQRVLFALRQNLVPKRFGGSFQLVRTQGLEQKVGNADFDAAFGVLKLVMSGHHHDADGRVPFHHHAAEGDAVDGGHADVGEDDVRLNRVEHGQRLARAGGFRGDFHPDGGPVHTHADEAPDELLVIHNHDTQPIRAGITGERFG